MTHIALIGCYAARYPKVPSDECTFLLPIRSCCEKTANAESSNATSPLAADTTCIQAKSCAENSYWENIQFLKNMNGDYDATFHFLCDGDLMVAIRDASDLSLPLIY